MLLTFRDLFSSETYGFFRAYRKRRTELGPRTKSWTARRSGREVRMHSREDVELALMALEEGWT
ncbi:hypothetical protein B5F89_04210, partial [Collinsella sp. An307]